MARIKKTNRPLISVIIPVYNAAKYLPDTIQSVQSQTYDNWELILVDDCSQDESIEIIKIFQKTDKRIALLRNKKNSGPAITRNNGIEVAKGDFVCFLDADDAWLPTKLEEQLDFARGHGYAFTFTGYQFADANCDPTGAIVRVPKEVNYKQALKNTTISTITVMFDMSKLSKKQIMMPNIGDRNEDFACWLQVLKIAEVAGGLNRVLSLYRRTKGTLSSNKIDSVKQVWRLYRDVEHLHIFYSLYCLHCYIFNAIKRRV